MREVCLNCSSMTYTLYQNSESLREAQLKYYRLNGLPEDGGEGDPWARYKLGTFILTAFPNFNHRMEAIRRHDVHHILNDLDASNLGEGLIAAWELGSGCGKYWLSWFMESQAFWYGIIVARAETWKLFLNGRRSRNFYHEPFTPEIFNHTVGYWRKKFLAKENPRVEISDYAAFAGCLALGTAAMAIFIPIMTFFSVVGALRGEARRV